MSAWIWTGLLLSIAIAIYVLVAMLRAEDFS